MILSQALDMNEIQCKIIQLKSVLRFTPDIIFIYHNDSNTPYHGSSYSLLFDNIKSVYNMASEHGLDEQLIQVIKFILC